MVTGFECVDHFVFRYFVCLIFISVRCFCDMRQQLHWAQSCKCVLICAICDVPTFYNISRWLYAAQFCPFLASVENMGLSRNLIVHKDWVSIDSIPEPVVFAPSLGKRTADLFIARCFALLRCLLLVLRPLLLVALLNAKIAPLHCFLPVALLDALM